MNERIEISGAQGRGLTVDFGDKDKPIKLGIEWPHEQETLDLLMSLEMSALTLCGYAKTEQVLIPEFTDPVHESQDVTAKPKRTKSAGYIVYDRATGEVYGEKNALSLSDAKSMKAELIRIGTPEDQIETVRADK